MRVELDGSMIRIVIAYASRVAIAAALIQALRGRAHLRQGYGGRGGKAKQGYLWAASSPGGSLVYHWGIGRGQDQLVETLGGNYPV